MADILGIDRRENKENPDYKNLMRGIIPNGADILRGYFTDEATDYRQYRVKSLIGNVPKRKDGKQSRYDHSRYAFFLDAPFEISNKCCDVMKKAPIHRYAKETGRKPITGQLASESRLRTQQWLRHGCNGFDMKEPISNPMSFWTEQDILRYIRQNGERMTQDRIDYLEGKYGCRLEEIINTGTGKPAYERSKMRPIASVYGDVIVDYEAMGEDPAQMRLEELLQYEDELPLKTTGCDRTGCMFCGYGCHLEKPGEGRFERMRITHPKQYDYIMRSAEEGGLNYKEIIDWINEHGDLNIKY